MVYVSVSEGRHWGSPICEIPKDGGSMFEGILSFGIIARPKPILDYLASVGT